MKGHEDEHPASAWRLRQHNQSLIKFGKSCVSAKWSSDTDNRTSTRQVELREVQETLVK